MRTKASLIILVAVLGFITSCQKNTDVQPLETADISLSDSSIDQKSEMIGWHYPRLSKKISRASLINQVDDPHLPKGEKVGNTMLVRTRKGIYHSLKANQLTPGHIVTVWAVIFNQPGNCDTYPEACQGSDLSNPDVLGDAVYTAGGQVKPNGTIQLRAFLREGDASGSMAHEVSTAFPPTGLLDVDDAEIHFVIRDHGPAIPGLEYEQASSFAGGCSVSFPPFSAFPVQEGECGNIFAAIHLAD